MQGHRPLALVPLHPKACNLFCAFDIRQRAKRAACESQTGQVVFVAVISPYLLMQKAEKVRRCALNLLFGFVLHPRLGYQCGGECVQRRRLIYSRHTKSNDFRSHTKPWYRASLQYQVCCSIKSVAASASFEVLECSRTRENQSFCYSARSPYQMHSQGENTCTMMFK